MLPSPLRRHQGSLDTIRPNERLCNFSLCWPSEFTVIRSAKAGHCRNERPETPPIAKTSAWADDGAIDSEINVP